MHPHVSSQMHRNTHLHAHRCMCIRGSTRAHCSRHWATAEDSGANCSVTHTLLRMPSFPKIRGAPEGPRAGAGEMQVRPGGQASERHLSGSAHSGPGALLLRPL